MSEFLTRNERQRRLRRIVHARTLLEEANTRLSQDSNTQLDLPARASDYYIRHLKELAEECPGLQVVLYLRESSRTQARNGNFDGQEAFCRQELELLGVTLVEEPLYDVASGWAFDDRPGFRAACEAAKNRGVPLVSASLDRTLRSREYHSSEKPDAVPTVGEFEELKRQVDGVLPATIIHPDTPPDEVRGNQSRWGQLAKRNKGGRPKKNLPGYKKERREQMLPEAQRMRKAGYSYSRIAKVLGVSRSTCQDWCKGIRKGCSRGAEQELGGYW
jgi:DNA invertase Pin-like site-specific DNA recombinase